MALEEAARETILLLQVQGDPVHILYWSVRMPHPHPIFSQQVWVLRVMRLRGLSWMHCSTYVRLVTPASIAGVSDRDRRAL